MIRARLAPLAAPGLAVLCAGVLGGALVLVAGGNPLEVLGVVTRGLLGTSDGFGGVVFNATTLAFTGLSVAFAFRAGLFNIGAEGQLLVGSFAAAVTAIALGERSALLVVPACVLAAAAGGAAWGVIPGLLRAKLGVHEVINTIMMNFVAAGLTGYLTVHVLREPGEMIPQTPPVPVAAHVARLGDLPLAGGLFPPSSPANVAVFLALAVAALAAWLLARTPLGFEMRATAAGERAARTNGIPVAATWVRAMAIAGAIAGLAGVNEVLGFRHRFVDGFTSGVGFLGIAVALLGRGRVSGVLGAAALFGVLGAGAVEIDLFTEVPREVVLVVQAGILLFLAGGDELVRRLARRAS
ncbi:MAG: ABC transporter permease [Candidatus Eiseniibacteriota bacterium]